MKHSRIWSSSAQHTARSLELPCQSSQPVFGSSSRPALKAVLHMVQLGRSDSRSLHSHRLSKSSLSPLPFQGLPALQRPA